MRCFDPFGGSFRFSRTGEPVRVPLDVSIFRVKLPHDMSYQRILSRLLTLFLLVISSAIAASAQFTNRVRITEASKGYSGRKTVPRSTAVIIRRVAPTVV